VCSWGLHPIYFININIWSMKTLPWILLLITTVLILILKFVLGSFWIALASVVTGSLSILLFFKNYFDKRN
jgi:hypothetical protein